MDHQVLIVGGGHNGLVCGCYLARQGLEVTVLEQSDRPGGGSRTEETVPGHRFDTHSVAHNIINMTGIPAELDLAAAGLEYVEMEPFAMSAFTDGRIVRFHRDIDATVDSIAAHSGPDAATYRSFMDLAVPFIDTVVSGVQAGAATSRILRRSPGRAVAALRALRRAGGPTLLTNTVLSSYDRLLRERLASDLTRAPVAAFAAHTGASPVQLGTAMFALWQAAYHRFGQWHAVGGAQGLTDALVRRFQSLGGHIETCAAVERIIHRHGTVQGVGLADGTHRTAAVIVTAMDPRAALLDLLDPPLQDELRRSVAATHRDNTVQMLVHLAVDRLPAYPQAARGDWSGLQSYVDSMDSLVDGFTRAQAGYLPDDPVPTYAFTTSALDDTLAPRGGHTMYLACPCAPFAVHGGWDAAADGFAHRMIDTVAARVPGFRDTIVGMSIRTPDQMARELAWPGAHPMVLDITLDQLAWMRPVPALGGHDTPVRGLFVSGAGTAPVGGIAGTPGRATAQRILALHGRPSARSGRS